MGDYQKSAKLTSDTSKYTDGGWCVKFLVLGGSKVGEEGTRPSNSHFQMLTEDDEMGNLQLDNSGKQRRPSKLKSQGQQQQQDSSTKPTLLMTKGEKEKGRLKSYWLTSLL